jgi:hypothetical protein
MARCSAAALSTSSCARHAQHQPPGRPCTQQRRPAVRCCHTAYWNRVHASTSLRGAALPAWVARAPAAERARTQARQDQPSHPAALTQVRGLPGPPAQARPALLRWVPPRCARAPGTAVNKAKRVPGRRPSQPRAGGPQEGGGCLGGGACGGALVGRRQQRLHGRGAAQRARVHRRALAPGQLLAPPRAAKRVHQPAAAAAPVTDRASPPLSGTGGSAPSCATLPSAARRLRPTCFQAGTRVRRAARGTVDLRTAQAGRRPQFLKALHSRQAATRCACSAASRCPEWGRACGSGRCGPRGPGPARARRRARARSRSPARAAPCARRPRRPPARAAACRCACPARPARSCARARGARRQTLPYPTHTCTRT